MSQAALADIPKAYDPRRVEGRIYQMWLDGGHFTPRIDPAGKPFTIIMPPTNVTGELHYGHTLVMTLEDIMIRWHRMRGDPTLWLPGTDHAGIGTQNVVEQVLAQEGTNRHELGREKFLERTWEWARTYRQAINDQIKLMGASCDWTRDCFTMDEGPMRAVRTTFVRLFEQGLIYRGERIISWCPRCQTALSDLEVDHIEAQSHLYYINYLLDESEGAGHVTVATTRPETLLGDTAVAVSPSDARYKALVGKSLILPVLGRRIALIEDEAVDPSFGTGAVKVTPAHDPTDFEIGQRHGLETINILNRNGTLNENAGKYAGQDRYEARENILAELGRTGLLQKIEPYVHSVGHCVRCRTPIEPMVSKQWFVKIAPLAVPAIDAVADGRIRIVPERFVKDYLNWMENIRDWCISRQLWWGHRIPVWYCAGCQGESIFISFDRPQRDSNGQMVSAGSYAELRARGFSHADIERHAEWMEAAVEVRPIVAMEAPRACPDCSSPDLLQDLDVLDTWFSSALWPHSTLGWPDDTQDLRYFYPTSVLETAYDILFFWVARMIMMGLENMGDVPFRVVYLHGLVRDENGEKVSKSKGNVVSPVEAIQTYGTDALRLAVSIGVTPGNDMKLSATKLEAGRNFANKLWNAARYVLTSSERLELLPLQALLDGAPDEDRWIISRLEGTTANVNRLFEDYQFGEAARQAHDFFWGEFCDWYIEMSKPRLREPGARSPAPVLVHVLERSLRLLHPFIPFVTEEVWQNLRARLADASGLPPALIVAAYPRAEESALEPEIERRVEGVMEIVREIRNARAGLNVDAARWIPAALFADEALPFLAAQAPAIETLARARPLSIHPREEKAAHTEKAMVLVLHDAEVMLPLSGLMDVEAERKRLLAEIAKQEGEVGRLEAKLANKDFLLRAPERVVATEREKLLAHRDRLERLRERLVLLE